MRLLPVRWSIDVLPGLFIFALITQDYERFISFLGSSFLSVDVAMFMNVRVAFYSVICLKSVVSDILILYNCVVYF